MIRKFIFRAILIGALLLALLGAVVWFFPGKFLCVDSGPVTAEVIVVLGGGQNERPIRAARLFAEHAAAKIIITGAGDDQINRQLLLKNGVPAAAIEVENKSQTTRENAEFTIKLLRARHVHSAILVTSWYHARRSLHVFEHYGPEIKFYARPSYYGYARNEWVSRGIYKHMRLEFLKVPGYWIYYGVNPF